MRQCRYVETNFTVHHTKDGRKAALIQLVMVKILTMHQDTWGGGDSTYPSDVASPTINRSETSETEFRSSRETHVRHARKYIPTRGWKKLMMSSSVLIESTEGR